MPTKAGLPLLSLLVVFCTNEAQPILDVVEGRDLGPQLFARDATDGDGQGDDLVDVDEVSDGADVPTQLGAPCLLLSGGCGLGLKCTLSIDGHGTCQISGEQSSGSPCGAGGHDDCRVGLLCIDPGRPDTSDGLMCYPFCNFETGEGCETGVACVEGPSYAVEPVGICVPIQQE